MARNRKRKIPKKLFGIAYPKEICLAWIQAHGNPSHEVMVKRVFTAEWPDERYPGHEEAEKKLRERTTGFRCGCPRASRPRELARAKQKSAFYFGD